MSVLEVIRLSLTVLLVITVVLPLVRSDYWVFRILEYPRFQKFILCVAVLLTWAIDWHGSTLALISAGSLAVCSLFLLYLIFPYTPLAGKEMLTLKNGSAEDRLRVFAANVYEKNRDYEKLLRQIDSCDPDIIFLVETDEKWKEGVGGLLQKYPHTLEKPLDNTYGMLLFSRLRLKDAHIRFLVDQEVPSADLVAVLASGREVRVWGLHPKPPVPGEDERTTAKDKELLLVAEKAKNSNLPVIVMGDLNDVAWSYTTKLFRKTSRLLDPRRGRGFYSTFNANSVFMRFPLDYIFCSNDFGLISMKRLSKNGSDHFPMFIELQYDPELKNKQKRPKADKKERERSEEKKSKSA